MHSIFFCPHYPNLRSKFLDKKFLENKNLNTFTILISNERYQIQFSKYLKAMFSLREKNGRQNKHILFLHKYDKGFPF